MRKYYQSKVLGSRDNAATDKQRRKYLKRLRRVKYEK